MPKLIPLTRGKHAIVDDKYFDVIVAMGKWTYHKTGYAIRNRSRKERRRGVKGLVRMHRVVLRLAGVRLKRETDHRNQNKLDNRRRNLRAATTRQNVGNRKAQSNNTSGYKGVCWNRCRKRWQAQIGVRGTNVVIGGSFKSKEDAARAYDKAARKHFGRFAFLNFPRA